MFTDETMHRDGPIVAKCAHRRGTISCAIVEWDLETVRFSERLGEVIVREVSGTKFSSHFRALWRLVFEWRGKWYCRGMTIALAVITAVAALTALRVPEQYMEPGAPRLLLQAVAVVLALYLGEKVASYGPAPPGPLSFMQIVVVAILVLGLVMRVMLRRKTKP